MELSQSQWDDEEKIIPSTYNIPGLNYGIEHITNNNNEDHLICIKYKQGDTQIGISETRKKTDKTSYDTMIRGICEELNILIENINIEHELCVKTNKRHVKIYCININETTRITQLLNMPKEMNELEEENDRKRKVLILMYGKKNIIMEKINKFSTSERGIGGINLIPIKDLKNIYGNICEL